MWSWLHNPAGEQLDVFSQPFLIVSTQLSIIIICLTDISCIIFFFLVLSSCGSEGPGQMLIQTVKLAFSVTNNVIRLKPSSDTVSPLEQALTQHGGHGNNLIVVLAKYIYHKHDPALPRLAIQLLKRLATVRLPLLNNMWICGWCFCYITKH